jgi:eukaryotic-like serine/threonine-protein kinase
MPGFPITEFSLSPDGTEIAFSAVGEDGTPNIWLAHLDRSSSPRLLQSSAKFPRFTSKFIYYVRQTPAGRYVHRILPDGSGDEQIWDERIISLGTSPDGRYLAVTLPLKEKQAEWKLELVDWAQKHIQPVCNDANSYWSDDGKSFIATDGLGKRNRGAQTYVISLPVAGGMPELPANGLSSFSQFAELKHARTISARVIGPGRTADIYAYVKETVQRNLYRIPLR